MTIRRVPDEWRGLALVIMKLLLGSRTVHHHSPSLTVFYFPSSAALREVQRRSDSVQTDAIWVCVIWNRLGAGDPNPFSNFHYAHPLPPILQSFTLHNFTLTSIISSLGSPVSSSSSVDVIKLCTSLLMSCIDLSQIYKTKWKHVTLFEE